MVYKGASAHAVAAAMVTQGRDSPGILLQSNPINKKANRRSTLRNYNYTGSNLGGEAGGGKLSEAAQTRTMPFRRTGMNLVSQASKQ